MKISVIGTGYVGLVAGACLADMGNEVICVDNDKQKLKMLKNGDLPFYEFRLEELVKLNISKGRLSFSQDIDFAIKNSQVCFIAVGTPQNKDGSADISEVVNVAKNIAKAMNEYKLIIIKSTVPVGTTEEIKNLIKQNTKCDFDIVFNPEFLKQGNAVDDFLSPDRVIIGTDSAKALNLFKTIFSSFFKLSDRIIAMDIKSAELTKYAANTFLATKISFMNEIANLCEKTGANIDAVRQGISTDERIGKKFLFAGIGYGGSCFPKDVSALMNISKQNDCQMSIIQAVQKVNKNQRRLFIEKIKKFYNYNLKNKTIAVWGLSFKPKTNDMREAPSIYIINKLLEQGAKIKVFDPQAMQNAKNYFAKKVTYANDSYNAIEGADCLLLLTEWNEFRNPDFDKMKELMASPVIFDGRNQYDSEFLSNKGFIYNKVGSPLKTTIH